MTGITFEILAREPFADGHAFGAAGAYERIDARAHVSVDPAAPAQAGVFDIEMAPRDSDGLVRCSIDLWLLKPVEPARGNGALVVEFPNRGNKRCLQFFNDAPATNDPRTLAHAGNGWLMREGLCGHGGGVAGRRAGR
jgi:hypothetical protein